jgi:hypothetical protein
MADLTKVYRRYFEKLVTRAGGQFVGIQESENGDHDLLLFNSLVTGSTLALRLADDVTEDKVRQRIEDSNKTFRHMR